MPTAIGRRRHLVAVLTLKSTANSGQSSTSGEIVLETEDTGVTWWAAMEPVSGDEAIAKGQLAADATVLFKGAYLSSLTETCELQHGGLTYDIIRLEKMPDGVPAEHWAWCKVTRL